MAASLIGEDCAVAILFGTMSAGDITWDGGGGFGISGKAKRVTQEVTVELTNTKGLGDAGKLHRSHSRSARIEVERMVSFDGYDFISGNEDRTGDPCQISIKEYSGLGTPGIYEGIVQSWKAEIQEGEAQIESLVIVTGVDQN